MHYTNKEIFQHSNIELLDTIKTDRNKVRIDHAKKELARRNLTKEQEYKLNTEYIQYKKNQKQRAETSLTNEEFLTFFILPFFIAKNKNDQFSESEMDRFKKHGFNKKIKQATIAKTIGFIFWFFILVIVAVIARNM
ncbi:hypothetical protein [Tenacibaculum jejuense]|uniref:Uncharacterized protein n=1 Tax=Tenacibaculum jejuense TaxID=584609 RepID=A0A238U538_9FLAO|nr:hypothetical protein [Tenacibaculum jejuense]SNR14155.1 conserved protein of unknown function [Tenacibaculum jejuense]